MDRYDVAVIGGGLLGLATARDLLGRRPGLRLVLLEKEPELALGQSGRNSGVVHSGIYYRPGSLKARLCAEGRALLERFAGEHGVPYKVRGKLIVAVDASEEADLQRLTDRARANGVEGIEEVGPERIRELEPHVEGVRGLYSPATGVTDFRAVALALGGDVESLGGTVLRGSRVASIGRSGSQRVIRTTRGDIRSRFVVGCAGLQSDRVAALSGAAGGQRIVPFRGTYHLLTPSAAGLVNGLVYPVPDPRLPFLGVHFTRGVDDRVLVGPSAVLALAREGTRPWHVDLEDVTSTLGFAGFWKLAARHWRTGLEEIRRDLSRNELLKACRRYVPELRADHLLPGSFGVRAQAVNRDGSLEDDFSLSEGDGILHLRNAPSPGATSCLAIGRMLAGQVLGALEP